MRVVVLAGLAVCAGCGRIGFAGTEQDAVALGDASGDSATVPFCATRMPAPLFCDDFEGDDTWAPLGPLDGTWLVEMGTLVVTSPAITSGSAVVNKAIDLAASARRVRYAFDVRVETVGTSAPVLAYLRFDDGVAAYHGVNYVYRLSPGLANIEDVAIPYVGNRTYTFFEVPPPPPASWHRVEVAIDLDTPLLTSTLDGVQVLSAKPAVTTGGTLRLVLGIPYVAGPAEGWQFRFDNVILETW